MRWRLVWPVLVCAKPNITSLHKTGGWVKMLICGVVCKTCIDNCAMGIDVRFDNTDINLMGVQEP